MTLKKLTRRQWIVVVVIVGLFVCPIVNRVSDEVVITVLNDRGEGFGGVAVRQMWGVYGWGGMGGSETRVTQESGEVRFPPRYVVGFVGMRALRRAKAFYTQCMAMVVFGRFGSQFTERWGPILGHDLDLPPGIWLPAAWDVTPDPARDVLSPHVSGGLHRYITLHNINPDRPTAYIGGDQLGFFHDAKIELRLRKATDDEKQRVLGHPSRPSLLEMLRREGR